MDHKCTRVRAMCELSVSCALRKHLCNVVIGVLVVLCELHVIVSVHVIPLCGAVVGLTLGLLAHVVVVVFVVVTLQRIFCIWRYTLLTPLGDSKLLLTVT